MIRIVIADDHAVVRQGVVRVIEHMPDMELVAEAASGTEALDALVAHSPDVCLLDLGMPDGGIDAIGLLRAASPATAILVFSMQPEAETAGRCFNAGAAGYLGKGASPLELTASIRAVAAEPGPADAARGHFA